MRASATRVDGTVKVESGGTLIMQSARINGNVQADKFRSITINGGRVGGSIQLKEGGNVSIQGVRVNGDIQLEKNRGTVRVFNNVVGGNLQCQENSPAPTGSGNPLANRQRLRNTFPSKPDNIQGGVVERFMAAVLKTAVGQPTVGSNPTPSAIFDSRGCRCFDRIIQMRPVSTLL